MTSIEEVLKLKNIDYSVLSNKQGYEIHHDWLELFAKKVKEQTGRYTINGFVWGAYWSGLLPSLDGQAGWEQYQSKDMENFYIIYENGKKVFDCDCCVWPSLLSLEAIVLPKNQEWSMVFSHEQTMHYVEQKLERPRSVMA